MIALILKATTRKPVYTLVFLLLGTAFFGYGLTKLQTRFNFDGELPENDPITAEFNLVTEHFDERPTLLVGIETESIFNPATLQKIKDLTSEIEGLTYVLPDEVKSLATLKNVQKRDWGVGLDGFLDTIPTRASDLRKLESDIRANQSIDGKFVSTSGNFTVISAHLEDDFKGDVVLEEARELLADYEGPEKLHLSGAPILVEDVQEGISGDSRRFIPIAILLVFFGFFHCFRKLRGTLLPAIMVIVCIVWTMGFMGFAGLPVTVVSNALPVIMVAVASSYGIHFMNSYYIYADESETSVEAVEKTLNRIAKPILITGLTSALGSASLLIFRITSLREFGIIGAAGFLFATLICLTLLPSVSVLLKLQRKKRGSFPILRKWLDSITSWAATHQRSVILGYAVILPLCAISLLKIQTGDDYTKFFPSTHPSRIASNAFNDHLSGARIMDVMVESGNDRTIKDQAFFERLNRFQEEIARLPHVGSVHSYIDIINHLRQNFNPPQITGTEELTSAEISQYLMLYEMSADPGDMYTLFDEGFHRARLQTFIKSSNPEDHRELYRSIKSLYGRIFNSGLEGLALGGDVVNRIALGEYIVRGKIQNIILAILFVLITCSLLLRSFRKGLLTIVPIGASLLMIFGVMGLVGIRLGISTSLLTAMVVGVGIDFAVHYLMAYFEARAKLPVAESLHETATHTGKAIFFDAASNIGGFSVLSFSGFLPIQHFGWLLAFSMLLIFLNTMVMYPGLFALSALGRSRQQGRLIHEIAKETI